MVCHRAGPYKEEKDKELYHSIVAYLQQEKKGNQEEIEKFYQLIES